jgi:hypothetical protein
MQFQLGDEGALPAEFLLATDVEAAFIRCEASHLCLGRFDGTAISQNHSVLTANGDNAPG